VSEAYQRYVFCKTFGWDYYQYDSQPAWFIEELLIIMNQENKKQKREAEKNKPKTPQVPQVRLKK